jgi:hypothetical protein
MFQAIERRVQRALLNLEAILRNLLNAQKNAVSMQRAEGDRLEDQHVQRPLQEIDPFCHWLSF